MSGVAVFDPNSHSGHMSNGKRKPDQLATVLGHAIVGGAAAYVVAKGAKAALPALVLGLVAVFMHAQLDAPVSQKLSDLGL